jgi:hypothetical protein
MITDIIHEDWNKASIARRYYSELGIDLSNEQAKKKFYQENKADKLDEGALRSVLIELSIQQKRLLKVK